MKKQFEAVKKIVEALKPIPRHRHYSTTEFAMSILRSDEDYRGQPIEPMPVAPQPANTPDPEPKQEQEPEKEKSEYTITDIRKAIKDYAKNNSKTKALKVISSFGVEKINDLPTDKYNDFMGKM